MAAEWGSQTQGSGFLNVPNSLNLLQSGHLNNGLPQSSDGGSVTAFLIPTEKFVSSSSDEGPVLFPLTAGVNFSGDEKVAGSMPVQHQLSFPQYAVYLANHSDRPVKAQFFVYLRH